MIMYWIRFLDLALWDFLACEHLANLRALKSFRSLQNPRALFLMIWLHRTDYV